MANVGPFSARAGRRLLPVRSPRTGIVRISRFAAFIWIACAVIALERNVDAQALRTHCGTPGPTPEMTVGQRTAGKTTKIESAQAIAGIVKAGTIRPPVGWIIWDDDAGTWIMLRADSPAALMALVKPRPRSRPGAVILGTYPLADFALPAGFALQSCIEFQ